MKFGSDVMPPSRRLCWCPNCGGPARRCPPFYVALFVCDLCRFKFGFPTTARFLRKAASK